MSWQNFLISTVIRIQKKSTMKLKPEHRFNRLRKLMAMDTGGARQPVTCKADTIEGVPVEWILPEGTDSNPNASVCVYYHGGAFFMGGMNSHRQMCAYLAMAANIQVVMVDYRLAPEHPFPAATDDAATVYSALIAAGYASNKMVLAGDSAGGNIVLRTLQKLRDEDSPHPAAAVLFSPWLDLSHASDSFTNNARMDVLLNKTLLDEAVAMYAPELPLDDPKISPLFGSLADLPPVLIIASRSEVLLDDATRLHTNIRTQGGDSSYLEWEKTPHAFPAMSRFLPEAREALDRSASFIAQHLA
ncbi:MAG: monoterpene epsilon-lactone hydrolase [Bermanella sp.]|jgi:monoterpene epsilon-lactone hydrolase